LQILIFCFLRRKERISPDVFSKGQWAKDVPNLRSPEMAKSSEFCTKNWITCEIAIFANPSSYSSKHQTLVAHLIFHQLAFRAPMA
jgi:hypothetical protein